MQADGTNIRRSTESAPSESYTKEHSNKREEQKKRSGKKAATDTKGDDKETRESRVPERQEPKPGGAQGRRPERRVGTRRSRQGSSARAARKRTETPHKQRPGKPGIRPTRGAKRRRGTGKSRLKRPLNFFNLVYFKDRRESARFWRSLAVSRFPLKHYKCSW